ncbi:MAG: alanyl-tRNA editing protein [Alphaproteobacteria bacterium]|nr:alanyl-tRNA editing protein [Alphaproteobacteria bacterium]
MTLVFREDAYARSCDAVVVAVGPEGIRLDRTVFYPEGGGQPGDTGVMRLPEGTTITIVDARKGSGGDDVVHIPGPGSPMPDVGAAVVAEIDWERRHRLMRMHSCLHLLCALVDAPVTGGQVGDGRGRLDFDLPEATLDRVELGVRLNAIIAENRPLSESWITDAELAVQPELVKTMSVKPPIGLGRVRLMHVEGVDLQPCGGTHVRATGEIGPVEIVKIEKKGRINRRVTVAFAGTGTP